MSQTTERGFGPVLANTHFRALWIAQLLAQTSQHAIHFIQMVLIEHLTGSAVHLGLVILAFTLPGVIFSPIAGVVVDRFPKKWVLVASNSTRVILVASYIIVLNGLHGTWELLAIYAITFIMATLAQFFSPAEASTIPFLVGEEHLLAANSLFTLTMALSQVIGLLMLGPLATSLLHVQGGFLLIGLMYLVATVLVSTIPPDKRLIGVPETASAVGFATQLSQGRASLADSISGWRQVWREFQEGWRFVSSQRKLKASTTHLVTIATLVMVMAMLAPGYAARVLGMAPENAVIVFAPAGAGMLLATGLIGRWGYLFRRAGFEYAGLALVGLAFGAMGVLSMDYQRLLRPILQVYPQAAFSLTTATMALSFVLGFCMSGVNILAQTILQQKSPAYIRGRVFSVQFMLNNLLGIPPMLALGGIADAIGIPRVLEVVGLATLVMVVVSVLIEHIDLRFAWLSTRVVEGEGEFSDEAEEPRLSRLPHTSVSDSVGYDQSPSGEGRGGTE